ncbi:MAG: 1-acyl-sn-glycerol-3-phosphate acyltransferase [Clostridia bacterium]|nr:1-acyl-sn-glycerol-3-phosphate acyltransferase [Clostridia bacterium]
MKIKTKDKAFEDVLALPVRPHKKPLRQSLFWRTLLRFASAPDLHATHFSCKRIGMEKLSKKEPALFLMNHSSFIDLKIASTILYPRPFNIVCTTDGFVGKNWLMRSLGCIPTNKFVSDLNLVRDMVYALKKLNSSVLMYPEAGYTFDGTSTLLPDSLGKCAKLMGVPVVMIRTYGAFARDPLYNNLQRRHVKVEAEMEYLLSPEQIKEMPAEEIARLITEKFTFDNFRWQQENNVRIDEAFRADHLNRILYKCPACGAEGCLRGKGVTLSCNSCGKEWTLDEYGYLHATAGETEFSHIPDWFAWERECARREIAENRYHLDVDVEIYVLADTRCLYHVGEGHLTHSRAGFHLTGCNGKLDYTQGPFSTYTLNADFNWYELGDVISIGNNSMLYYCIPKSTGDCVAKARLVTEELYKMLKDDHQRAKETAKVGKKT